MQIVRALLGINDLNCPEEDHLYPNRRRPHRDSGKFDGQIERQPLKQGAETVGLLERNQRRRLPRAAMMPDRPLEQKFSCLQHSVQLILRQVIEQQQMIV